MKEKMPNPAERVACQANGVPTVWEYRASLSIRIILLF